MNLSKNSKISPAITPDNGTAGTTDIDAAILDMTGFKSVILLLIVGAITSGAVTSVKFEQGDAADLSDGSDLEGTGITIADDDDNETFVSDLIKPTKRYVRAIVVRGTQNAVVAGASYIQYEPGLAPQDHAAGVTVETHISPDEGTA